MLFLILFGLFMSFGYVTTSNGLVNLAFKTELEFSKRSDIQLIERAQKYLKQIKNILEDTFKKNKGLILRKKTTFTNFLHDAVGIMRSLNDEELKYIHDIAVKEFRKVNAKANLFDVQDDWSLRKLLEDGGGDQVTAKDIRNKLKTLSIQLKMGKYSTITNYINSIFRKYNDNQLNQVFNDLYLYGRNNSLNLGNIIKRGIKNIFTDHYLKLDKKGKNEIKGLVFSIWANNKTEQSISQISSEDYLHNSPKSISRNSPNKRIRKLSKNLNEAVSNDDLYKPKSVRTTTNVHRLFIKSSSNDLNKFKNDVISYVINSEDENRLLMKPNKKHKIQYLSKKNVSGVNTNIRNFKEKSKNEGRPSMTSKSYKRPNLSEIKNDDESNIKSSAEKTIDKSRALVTSKTHKSPKRYLNKVSYLDNTNIRYFKEKRGENQALLTSNTYKRQKPKIQKDTSNDNSKVENSEEKMRDNSRISTKTKRHKNLVPYLSTYEIVDHSGIGSSDEEERDHSRVLNPLSSYKRQKSNSSNDRSNEHSYVSNTDEKIRHYSKPGITKNPKKETKNSNRLVNTTKRYKLPKYNLDRFKNDEESFLNNSDEMTKHEKRPMLKLHNHEKQKTLLSEDRSDENSNIRSAEQEIKYSNKHFMKTKQYKWHTPKSSKGNSDNDGNVENSRERSINKKRLEALSPTHKRLTPSINRDDEGTNERNNLDKRINEFHTRNPEKTKRDKKGLVATLQGPKRPVANFIITKDRSNEDSNVRYSEEETKDNKILTTSNKYKNSSFSLKKNIIDNNSNDVLPKSSQSSERPVNIAQGDDEVHIEKSKNKAIKITKEYENNILKTGFVDSTTSIINYKTLYPASLKRIRTNDKKYKIDSKETYHHNRFYKLNSKDVDGYPHRRVRNQESPEKLSSSTTESQIIDPKPIHLSNVNTQAIDKKNDTTSTLPNQNSSLFENEDLRVNYTFGENESDNNTSKENYVHSPENINIQNYPSEMQENIETGSDQEFFSQNHQTNNIIAKSGTEPTQIDNKYKNKETDTDIYNFTTTNFSENNIDKNFVDKSTTNNEKVKDHSIKEEDTTTFILEDVNNNGSPRLTNTLSTKTVSHSTVNISNLIRQSHDENDSIKNKEIKEKMQADVMNLFTSSTTIGNKTETEDSFQELEIAFDFA